MSTPAEATRAVLGRGSFYTIATAAPALAAVAVLPIVTRALDAVEYGVVAVVLVVVQVGLILLGLGLGAAITRTAVIEAGGEAKAATLVLQGAVLATVTAVVLVATGRWWAAGLLGVPWSAAIGWAVVAAAAGSVVVLSQAQLRGLDLVSRYVTLGVVANLGGPVAGLILVLAVEPRAELYAVGLAGGQLVAALAGLADVLRRTRVPLSRRVLGEGLRVGLPTLPHQISLYLAVGGLVLIATHLLGPSGGGRANIVLTLGIGGSVLISAMNNAWAPAVYRAAPAERGAVLDDSTHRIGMLAACIAGTVALAGPWLLRILAPAGYAPNSLVAPLAVVTAATVLSVVYLASGHLVFASGRTTALALTTPLSVAIGLAVGGLVTVEVGLVGLALGYVVIYLMLALATTWVQRRVSETPWWPPLMPMTLAITGAVTVAGALLPVSGAGALIRVAAAAATALGAVAVLVRAVRPTSA